ncbi:hypothetical protein L208DRAFT_1391458 [Tricholoma matsutake]|nr:hypothetical protein L208DRAFT_1391458 [Tricholoma matsutake 945]
MRRLGEGSETGKSKPIKTIRAKQSRPNVGDSSISALVTPIECYDTSRQLTYFISNLWLVFRSLIPIIPRFWDLGCMIRMIL